ncbi:hypothetical protein PRNP1_005581 [Phytophthora ramorum]
MAYLLRCGARLHNTPAWTVGSYSTRSITTKKTRKWLVPTLATAGAATFAVLLLRDAGDTGKTGELEPELPAFSIRQVQEQAWVVYRHGVYDMTDFVGGHPGGRRILQASGKSIELFWQQSEPHSRAGALEKLEELRIGNLKQEDFDRMEEVKEKGFESIGDQELDSSALQQYFFIESASSLRAPEVDLEAFELKICGCSELDGEEEIALALAALKTEFKQHRVTTTIRCATPRTADVHVSTDRRVPAEWTGVLLVDVLASVDNSTATDFDQVRFEALDTDAQGRAFGTSIPAAIALDRDVGILLAYEMNGEPIPKEHGFPLRVVFPGATGARNVKFVHRIILI